MRIFTNDADHCRRLGWGPGTRIRRDGLGGVEIREILEVGRDAVFTCTLRGDQPYFNSVYLLDPSRRAWRRDVDDVRTLVVAGGAIRARALHPGEMVRRGDWRSAGSDLAPVSANEIGRQVRALLGWRGPNGKVVFVVYRPYATGLAPAAVKSETG